MKNYTYRLSVFDGDKEVFQESISYEGMMSLISSCPDSDSYQALYDFAAAHPSSVVREYVAGKDNLSKKTVELLSCDKSINVLRALIRSSAFKKYAGDKLLMDFISLDPEIARSIAEYYEQFEMADSSKLTAALLQSSEPSVLAGLVGNYSTSKKIIRELVNHPDSYVASSAKDRLKN
jgi:hypothetical protein